VSKQKVDGNPCALAAVDDDLCAIAIGSRVILLDFGAAKVPRPPVGNSDKKIAGLKVLTARETGAKAGLMVLFTDGTSAEWEIPLGL
jgi:hypothetical protein